MTVNHHEEFVITGVGLRCAVGQEAALACAAVRAGIAGFVEWPFMPDPADEEAGLVAAAVEPDLGDRCWVEKFEALALQPLLESIWMAGFSHLADSGGSTTWGLYLSVPSLDRPGVAPEQARDFEVSIRERDLFPGQPAFVSCLSQGHAGGLLALERAMADLREGTLEVCVVGGVESLLESECLRGLLAAGKLKTADAPEGLIPGEAAAFVVLERAEHAAARGAEALAALTAVRSSVETAPAFLDAPGRADATAQVLRSVLADLTVPPGSVQRIINDLNGERWRFLEWAMADSRVLRELPPYWRLWHPADCFGDVGAATGTAHLCIATRAFQRGYAAGSAILVCNASDSGERAALAVYPPRQS